MPEARVQVRLRTTADALFAFLADARNLSLWSSAAVAVRPGSVPEGEGARFQYRFPGRRRDHGLTCSVYRPCTEVAFLGDRMVTPLGTQTVRLAFQLHEAPDGVLLDIVVRARLLGPLAILAPFVDLAWKRDLPVDAQRLGTALAPRVQRMHSLHYHPHPESVRPVAAGHICRFSDGMEAALGDHAGDICGAYVV